MNSDLFVSFLKILEVKRKLTNGFTMPRAKLNDDDGSQEPKGNSLIVENMTKIPIQS